MTLYWIGFTDYMMHSKLIRALDVHEDYRPYLFVGWNIRHNISNIHDYVHFRMLSRTFLIYKLSTIDHNNKK